MDKVKDVVIDSDGVFKYILIKLTEKKKARSSSNGGSGNGSDHQQPRKLGDLNGRSSTVRNTFVLMLSSV